MEGVSAPTGEDGPQAGGHLGQGLDRTTREGQPERGHPDGGDEGELQSVAVDRSRIHGLHLRLTMGARAGQQLRGVGLTQVLEDLGGVWPQRVRRGRVEGTRGTGTTLRHATRRAESSDRRKLRRSSPSPLHCIAGPVSWSETNGLGAAIAIVATGQAASRRTIGEVRSSCTSGSPFAEPSTLTTASESTDGPRPRLIRVATLACARAVRASSAVDGCWCGPGSMP